MDSSLSWFEDLPPDCPPTAARIPKDEIYYRLAKNYPPAIEDFYSHRNLYPNKKFGDECKARSLSIFNSIDGCRNLLKMPLHRDKVIVKIRLDGLSGVILKTGKNKEHYSWWMSINFNPTENCEVA